MTPTPPKVYPGLFGPFVPAASALFRCAVIDHRNPRDVRYLGAEMPVRTVKTSALGGYVSQGTAVNGYGDVCAGWE